MDKFVVENTRSHTVAAAITVSSETNVGCPPKKKSAGSSDSGANTNLQLPLCDFGSFWFWLWFILIEPVPIHGWRSKRKILDSPISGADQQLNTFCGSPPYAAPELFRDESYLGGPVDVWALGVLLYFMVTAQIPFKAQTVASLKKHILDGSFTVPSYVSLPCRVLIEGILRQCPQERLTFTQIHNSEWLKGVGFPVQPGPTENYTLGPTMLPRCVPDDELGKDGRRSRRSSRSESLTGRCGSYPLGKLSDMEISARARLAELGITSTLLEEHEGRGVRSAVIGTYRIVVHRIQRQAMAASNTDTKVNEDANSTALPHSANTSANHHFCLSALGRRTKSAKPPASKSGKGNRSRTCTLL